MLKLLSNKLGCDIAYFFVRMRRVFVASDTIDVLYALFIQVSEQTAYSKIDLILLYWLKFDYLKYIFYLN